MTWFSRFLNRFRKKPVAPVTSSVNYTVPTGRSRVHVVGPSTGQAAGYYPPAKTQRKSAPGSAASYVDFTEYQPVSLGCGGSNNYGDNNSSGSCSSYDSGSSSSSDSGSSGGGCD